MSDLELISFKREVLKLLKENDRLEMEVRSRILHTREKLMLSVEEGDSVTPQEVFDRLMKLYPEKIVRQPRERKTEEEFAAQL